MCFSGPQNPRNQLARKLPLGAQEDRCFTSTEGSIPHHDRGKDPGDEPTCSVQLDAAAERDRHDPSADTESDRHDGGVGSDHITESDTINAAGRRKVRMR